MFRLIEPMPSPRGTNHAALFIERQGHASRPRDLLACHSARGARGHGARDEGESPETEILQFLESKLSENDYIEAEKMINTLADSEPVDRSDRTPGNGRPAGIRDSLARARDEDAETPDQMRQRHAEELSAFDRGARDRRLAADAARRDYEAFAKRWPNAARIRVL